MLVPELDDVTRRSFIYNSEYVKKNYPEFYKFLLEKYNFIPNKFTELLYLYFNNMDERPLCPMCGNPLEFRCFSKGYRMFCSVKCQRNSIETNNKIKKTCIERYGTTCALTSKDIRENIRILNLQRFGAENPFQSEEIKEKLKKVKKERYGDENYKNHEKMRRTKKERYGDENYVNHEKAKITCLERYHVDHPWKSPEIRKKIKEQERKIQIKIYNTKKKNHTFKTSKIEQSFKQWLDDNHINYEYQYKNDKYPFMCDFYFPDKDLYLEIQGNWTHGFHPYNSNNEDDQNTLNKWKEKNTKFYNIAIKVWTESDPLKRETAKKNGLNWVEVFTNKLDVLIEKVKPLII